MARRVIGQMQRLEEAGDRAGYLATVFVRGALYGTRRAPVTSASDAGPSRSAMGVGKHSVWQGAPRALVGGAPALRRW